MLRRRNASMNATAQCCERKRLVQHCAKSVSGLAFAQRKSRHALTARDVGWADQHQSRFTQSTGASCACWQSKSDRRDHAVRHADICSIDFNFDVRHFSTAKKNLINDLADDLVRDR